MKKYEKNNIVLLDDSYNANPAGVEYALQYLRRFKGRKIVVLGSMLELGKHSQVEHQRVVDLAITEEVDLLCVYGKETQDMHSDDVAILHFLSKQALIDTLKAECKQGDVVLVKGSRSLAMEEVVKEVYVAIS